MHDRISRGVGLLLLAIIISGCTPAARKSRVRERADRYFKAGDYDKAKIEYLNLLRRDHQSITAFHQLGFIWFEQGVPLRAIPFFLKVRELAPRDTVTRAKLALAFMSVGHIIGARQEALSILQQDPRNSDALLVLAETSRSPEEIAATEQELHKFPQRNEAAFHLAYASLAMRKGYPKIATEEIQQAIAVEPKSPRAHLAMAYAYASRRDTSQAGQEFKTAADLAPLRSGERIQYAEFQARNGAIADSKTGLQTITRQTPDYLPAWRVLAQISFTEKQYDESLSLLENIFRRDPENLEARILQSEVLMGKSDPGKAITVLDRLDQTYRNVPVIKYELGRAYIQSRNTVQAAAELEQAVTANPNYTEAILLLGELNLLSGKPLPVVRPMEDLLKKRPDLSRARLILADAYLALGRVDNAVALFREQIKMSPQSSEGYFRLGLLLRLQKRMDEARQVLEKASELAPDDLKPINQLVEIDLADKRFDTATERVQRQLKKNPDVARNHFMEAQIYATKRDWSRAEGALQKTIELDANFAAAYNLLISVYLATNKLQQGLSEVELGLAKRPKNTRALMLAALLCEKMKDYPKAADTYAKLLALKPDSVPALNNLASLCAERLNQIDRAYELAQKARMLQPDDASTADTLGWILYKRGNYQQGLALMQESVSKLPDNPEVQFHFGMTSFMMGQMDAARSALEKAVHAPVDFPGKDEAQRRLMSLDESSGEMANLPTTELEVLLKQRPNDLIVLRGLAEAYEKQGEPAKAATAYEQALKLNPKLLTADLKLAQLYAGPLQKRDRALELAKKARELAPNDAQVAGVLGHTAFQAGNFAWAYSLLKECTRQRPDDPAALHDLALTAYALGKVPEAREKMQRVLASAPNTAQTEDAKPFLAMTALDQPGANVLVAEKQVHEILKIQPDYVPALMVQAAIHLQHNDTKAAIDLYLQALQRYPDFAPAQKHLAATYAESSDSIAKAYELAIKARKALPDDPELARTLAELNFKRKEFLFAIQLFQESARREPLPPKDLYYLGIAQLQSQQDSEGRETLERALAAGLQDPLAGEVKERLAKAQTK